MPNTFYAIYNPRGTIVAIHKKLKEAKEQALRLSNYRWSFSEFEKFWALLESDGYSYCRVRIEPIREKKEADPFETELM